MILPELILSFAFAAVPPSTATSTTAPNETSSVSALEILSLPEKNREEVALSQENKEQLYQELNGLAFSKQESMPIRWRALTLSSLLKGKKALPDMNKALKSPEWFMRNAGLVALGRVAPEEAAEAAQKMINDKALVVRSAAIKVLGAKLNSERRDLLWEEIEKENNFRKKQSLWVRAQILEVLSKDPTAQEIPLFAKLLRDKDSRLHVYSVSALEKITNKKLGTTNSSLAQKRNLWLKSKL